MPTHPPAKAHVHQQYAEMLWTTICMVILLYILKTNQLQLVASIEMWATRTTKKYEYFKYFKIFGTVTQCRITVGLKEFKTKYVCNFSVNGQQTIKQIMLHCCCCRKICLFQGVWKGENKEKIALNHNAAEAHVNFNC